MSGRSAVQVTVVASTYVHTFVLELRLAQCAKRNRKQVHREGDPKNFLVYFLVYDGFGHLQLPPTERLAWCLVVSVEPLQVPVKQLAHLHILCKPLRRRTQSHQGSGGSETTTSLTANGCPT